MERLEKSNIKIDPEAMKLNPNSSEYKKILEELALEGEFDVHTTKINTKNVKDIDENYKFMPKNAIYKMSRAVVKSILYVFGPIVNKFAFNLKIKGRKNLKGLKSAVTVSNHVHFLDVLMNMQAMRNKNFYVVCANHNMKRGFTGQLFRASGVLPLSNSVGASVHLNQTIDEILKNGGFVHIYAESSLWFRYEQSRPLKLGAFKIAAKNNVPVVPIVILFRPKAKLEFFRHKKTVTLVIGKPIYPNAELNLRDNASNMRDLCQKYYNDTICDFYGYDKSTYSIYNKQNAQKNKSISK